MTTQDGAKEKAEHYAVHDVSNYICPACGEECWEMSKRDWLAGHAEGYLDGVEAAIYALDKSHRRIPEDVIKSLHALIPKESEHD